MVTDPTDRFDVENLRLPFELMEAVKSSKLASNPAPSTRRQRQPFIRLPWSWVARLTTAHGSTYRVAFHLLYQHWKTGGHPIRLANITLAKLGVSRRSKYRALRELEGLGLITVERHARKSPVITVIVDPRVDNHKPRTAI
jgi:hypothetical protein